ncbi:MAG: hypothetical protein QG578_1742 [Thermodesulfobacteriota bacterium]|jgi:hypothetical protein|nr:hypothetical protein [Thermodesulfobacteriota bacterium]
MGDTFYTLQDFYTHTKGVTYILIIVALIGIALFWSFLSQKDDEKKM